MNIFILITRGDSIGGAQVHVKDIARRLQEDGHKVTVGMGSEGVFSELLTKHKIAYIIIPGLQRKIHVFKDLKAFINIIQVLYRHKPDIIAMHSSKAGILGRIAGKLLGYPTVFTAHGWAFTDGKTFKERFVYKWIEKLATKLSNKIIAVSKYDESLYLKHKVGPSNKIVCIPNGVYDIEEVKFSQPEKVPPKIIMVARFQSPKDHLLLIRALYLLKDISWELDFIGEDGGLENEVKILVGSLGLDERVSFLGHQKYIENQLQQAQVFVLTSSWEGLPLTIIEAMRAGLPVIASDVGGVSELVIHKQTGFLIDSFDALVKYLESMLQSPSKRASMGAEGRIYYLEHFTFERMYRETLKIYNDVIHHKS